jgi:phosphohistidine phosphatase
MKQLMLVRHAKSSWYNNLTDFDRPLIQVGIERAKLVANELKTLLPFEYVIISSSAKRALETAKLFAYKLNYPFDKIIFDKDLYTFNDKILEKEIRNCNDCYENIILFGHNDAITNFVNKFGTIYIENVPTAGLVCLEFLTNSWSTISKGTTKKIIFPRDLK